MKNVLCILFTLLLMMPSWALTSNDFFNLEIIKKDGTYQLSYQLNALQREVIEYQVTFEVIDAKNKSITTITPLPLATQSGAKLDEKRAYQKLSMPLSKDSKLVKFLDSNAPYTITIKDFSMTVNALKLHPNYFKTMNIDFFDNRPYLTLEVNPSFHNDISYDATLAVKNEPAKVNDTINIKHKSPSKAYKQPIDKYSKALFDLLTKKQKPRIELTQLLVVRKIVENSRILK